MKKIALAALTGAAAFGTFQSCKTTPLATVKEGEILAPVPNQDIADAPWLERVSKKLRYGARPSPAEKQALVGKPKAKAVDAFLADQRFNLTLLDFNMRYFARQIDHLVADKPAGAEFTDGVWTQPQALAAAVAAAKGGDYFQLYNPSPALYYQRLPALTDETIGKIDALFDQSLKAFGAPINEAQRAMGCSNVGDSLQKKLAMQNAEFNLKPLGLDARAFRVMDLIAEHWIGKLARTSKNAYGKTGNCFDRGTTAAEMVAKLARIREATKAILMQMQAAAAPAGNDSPFAQLATVDVSAFSDLPTLNPALSYEGFWKRLKNTGSNMNRKRAAYVLRTFFCDDLTPASLADNGSEVVTQAVQCGSAPENSAHVRARHASAPACASCHYKMDPIGALFRFNGVDGESFAGARHHIFDDLTTYNAGTPDHSCYYNHPDWQDPANGKLRVGYFLSPEERAPEWQGETLDDLFVYLGKSDVARTCFTKKLTEFFLGPKQVYDGAWIDQLKTKVAVDTAPAQSTAAVKAVIKDLMLSKAIAQPDPDPATCYDFAEGASAGADRPPCEISFIIAKNCASCHSSSKPSRLKSVGINMMEWRADGTGKAMFTHLKPDGTPYSREESYRRVLRAVTSPGGEGALTGPSGEPLELMPLDSPMLETEKQALVTWLTNQMN